MCAVIGALLYQIDSIYKVAEANTILKHIWTTSHERGRDGRGYVISCDGKNDFVEFHDVTREGTNPAGNPPQVNFCNKAVVIGNLRAEPTTEYVKDKSPCDQQPYSIGHRSIVHNGTIANDAELRDGRYPSRIDSAAVVELIDLNDHSLRGDFDSFCSSILKLKGSYAILAMHHQNTEELFCAVNYKPLWYIRTRVGFFFASSRHYFPQGCAPLMITPYTAVKFTHRGIEQRFPLIRTPKNNKALVVCSGGLDSVVSATWAKRNGYDITLFHFHYGSRAQSPETNSILNVAKELNCQAEFFPIPIYSKSDSPLLDNDSKIAGGEDGAEFAHEWVPARNLVMLSLATAYAEAKGFNTIVLGNNLEESGAYADNDPEFIDKFNDIIPFAIGDGKQVNVIMPVGNLMKHEIVKLGHQIGAPMNLTWSCYRAGKKHCGTCGPCYMRRKAFEINGIEEVINYEN